MRISLRNRMPEIWGIIIEVKYAHDGNLDAACKEALKQIEYARSTGIDVTGQVFAML